MIGTSSWVTEAMRRTPPKITSAISTASEMPTAQGSQAAESSPKLPESVAWIVLACSELNATGKQTMRMIAKTMPIHRALRPRSM